MKRRTLFSLMIVLIFASALALSLSACAKDSPVCTVTVVISYSGTDEAGQDLPSGERTETFQVRTGDFFGEDISGHLYLNDKQYSQSTLFSIRKVETDGITLRVGQTDSVLAYGGKLDIPSLYGVCDGLNYSYSVTFSAPEAS